MSRKKDYYYMGISPEARIIFDDIARKYSERIDIALDFGELSIYAESCAKLARLNKEAVGKMLYYKTANGTWAAHPIRDEISMCQKQVHISGGKLGLSPDARNKIRLQLDELNERKQVDAEDEFLK